ncbi:hypothetical protein H0H87_011937 [Tephrocybe sp. NHM501043]|nr:hypothetical protein H0H87_011937 [Tephrocybe sp. NHM501043]
MSDVRDEIDWEFPGNQVKEGQTNFFWQGQVPTGSSNGHVETGLTDTYANYHDYTIDWQPKTLTFLIDEKVVRQVNAKDVSNYPNTPSRVQLSIWPAGTSASAEGTVNWGGGMINWKDPDFLAAGHFYAFVNRVTIECGDKNSRKAGEESYTYGEKSDKPTINVGANTLLKSGADLTIRSSDSFRTMMTGLLLLAGWFI